MNQFQKCFHYHKFLNLTTKSIKDILTKRISQNKMNYNNMDIGFYKKLLITNLLQNFYKFQFFFLTAV